MTFGSTIVGTFCFKKTYQIVIYLESLARATGSAYNPVDIMRNMGSILSCIGGVYNCSTETY